MSLLFISPSLLSLWMRTSSTLVCDGLLSILTLSSFLPLSRTAGVYIKAESKNTFMTRIHIPSFSLTDHSLVSSVPLHLSTVSNRELMSLLLVKSSWSTSALGTWGLCLSHWWACDWAPVNRRGHLWKETAQQHTWRTSTLHIATDSGSLRSPQLLWSFHLSWIVWGRLQEQ